MCTNVNIFSPVRCCITCDKLINMQNMTSNELSKLPPKALKEYIHAYNLPFKSAIEKSDLVRIIFNTRPISNENETYYRKHRTKQPNHNEDGGSVFSFAGAMQDIFSPPAAPSHRPEQARQGEEHCRRQQEQARRQREEQEAQARRQREEQEEQARRQREEHENQARRQREEQQRRQRTRSTSPTSPPASASSPPPVRPSSQPQSSNDNVLSLHDLIKNKIDPASLSVRTLKSILKANYVKQSHVIEKSELVKLVVRLIDQHRAEIEASKDDSGANEDSLCRVCFDRQQNCVFLDCGHMATCIECAKKVSTIKFFFSFSCCKLIFFFVCSFS